MKKKYTRNVAKRTKKWLKEKKMKYYRFDDQEDKKPKPNPASSCVEACLKLLLACVAKVDVVRMENPKPTGFGTEKP
ncbi:hypothetical protein CRYUN_Cryun15aG0129900 [Craigia yunnanensis]